MSEVVKAAQSSLQEFLDCVKIGANCPGVSSELANIYRDFRKELERTVLPNGTLLDNEIRKGAQSKQFMMQIVPYVQSFMRRHDKGKVFDVLDVGCGTGHGSNFLASLYQTMELGYRARVTALDIEGKYHAYAKFFCPYIVHKVVSDISDVKQKFDVVIASHVVEHVKNPNAFISALKERSKGILVVCAPYNEDRDMLTSGHINVIDDDMLASFQPTSIYLMESPAWGQFMEPRYRMFVAIFESESD